MLHVRADDSKRGVAHVFHQLLAQFDADTPLALISSFLSNAAIGCLLIRICCFMMLGFNVSNSAGTVMEVVQACEGFPRAFMLVVTGSNLSCFAYMTFAVDAIENTALSYVVLGFFMGMFAYCFVYVGVHSLVHAADKLSPARLVPSDV